jgi:ubiquinone biosynthesis protein UbiJ
MFAQAVINHLLVQEPWAREKLVKHAGKVAVIDAGIVIVRLKTAPDGVVETAGEDEPAHVIIRIKPADLPRIMQDRERAFSYVMIEGDAEFANTISQLSQSLRWDAEEDLSRWVGDIAARRMVSGARTTFSAMQDVHRKLAENTAEYFLEENPMLVRPEAVADFGAEVARLRDDVERLVKRIEKLTQQ